MLNMKNFSGPLGAFTCMMRVAAPNNLRPTLPPNIPLELVKIIQLAWDPEPESRYDIASLIKAVAEVNEIRKTSDWKSIEIKKIPGLDDPPDIVIKVETPPSDLSKSHSVGCVDGDERKNIDIPKSRTKVNRNTSGSSSPSENRGLLSDSEISDQLSSPTSKNSKIETSSPNSPQSLSSPRPALPQRPSDSLPPLTAASFKRKSERGLDKHTT